MSEATKLLENAFRRLAVFDDGWWWAHGDEEARQIGEALVALGAWESGGSGESRLYYRPVS